MERYKVIKEFSVAKKGDVFDKVEMEDEVIYIMEREENSEKFGINTSAYTGMTLGEDDMNSYIEEGYILPFNDDIDKKEEPEEDDEEINWEEIVDLTLVKIQDMIHTYENDHKKVIEDFEAGKVQPCVKVEADTVYFNMIKVLKEIQKTLTPNE